MNTVMPAPEIPALGRLVHLPPEAAVRGAAEALSRLVLDPSVEVYLAGLLAEARGARGWYVARSYEPPDRTYSLQVFVWPPGTETQIHDHTTWGAYLCAVGWVLEERYERLDNGSRPDFARLREAWELKWRLGDGVSTVLPYEGGIHRVGNPGPRTAVSVHLYGPRVAAADGRDYDPRRDYVCDRYEP